MTKKSKSKHPSKKAQSIHDIDRVIGAISYLPLLCLIPYVFFHGNAWVYNHARSGLTLFVFEIIVIAISIIPLLGWIIAPFLWLFVVVVSIIGISHALAGEEYTLPLLDKYVPKK